ncbi:MAG: hypothetical protein MUC83_19100 [Pirellula sp.]|jgi:hypothetical protein|nr:hypothetical protein [Pirellula sp.]
MDDNPYKTTSESTHYTNSEAGQTASEIVKASEDLAAIARWQAFFGFLGAFCCILLAITMVFQLLFVLGTSGLGGVEGLFSFGVFVLVLIAYGLPTIKLLKASQSARLCARQGESFSKMIEAQGSFWRTSGIVVCVTMGLYISVLVFAMFFGLATSRFF